MCASPGLPKAVDTIITKSSVLATLKVIDADPTCSSRVLAMETHFRSIITAHVGGLPANDAKFDKFSTSPFVLMIHSKKNGYSRISQIERDILPAKQFSSMETSAGRMVETVALPVYGWQVVPSAMHSANSALDGKMVDGKTLKLATLKSGPRCLNDEMSENFADSIVNHQASWANSENLKDINFTYGVLYGTKKISNKKDWHILRKIKEKISADVNSAMVVHPEHRWNCAFKSQGIDVSVSVRIGTDWWRHLGGDTCLIEVCVALIRACVTPGMSDPHNQQYIIRDLGQIVSTSVFPNGFNVGIIQESQLPWLLFLVRHFCDQLVDA